MFLIVTLLLGTLGLLVVAALFPKQETKRKKSLSGDSNDEEKKAMVSDSGIFDLVEAERTFVHEMEKSKERYQVGPLLQLSKRFLQEHSEQRHMHSQFWTKYVLSMETPVKQYMALNLQNGTSLPVRKMMGVEQRLEKVVEVTPESNWDFEDLSEALKQSKRICRELDQLKQNTDVDNFLKGLRSSTPKDVDLSVENFVGEARQYPLNIVVMKHGVLVYKHGLFKKRFKEYISAKYFVGGEPEKSRSGVDWREKGLVDLTTRMLQKRKRSLKEMVMSDSPVMVRLPSGVPDHDLENLQVLMRLNQFRTNQQHTEKDYIWASATATDGSLVDTDDEMSCDNDMSAWDDELDDTVCTESESVFHLPRVVSSTDLRRDNDSFFNKSSPKIPSDNIKIIMAQAGCSEKEAQMALIASKNDVVEAILMLA